MPNPTDGAVQAPVTMKVERQGSAKVPYVVHYPQVRAGTCEYCGVIDPYVPAQFQYKLCPHYRGQKLACAYCDSSKNPDEVNGKATLNITSHPDKPDTLVICCDSYECVQANEKRWTSKF